MVVQMDKLVEMPVVLGKGARSEQKGRMGRAKTSAWKGVWFMERLWRIWNGWDELRGKWGDEHTRLI